jgi:hypothetical protein
MRYRDQLVGGVDDALGWWRGPGRVIRVAVIVLPLAVPLTRTVLPTGNCAVVLGACVVPNCVWGVISTVYCMPLLAVTVQVDPFSAVILPVIPWGRPDFAGAVVVGDVVAVGVALGLLDPLEHPVTPSATAAPITPTTAVTPVRR